MDFSNFSKKLLYIPPFFAILSLIFDIFAFSHQGLGHFDLSQYENAFHGLVFLLYLWWCISCFTQCPIFSLISCIFIFSDKQIISYVTDRTKLLNEDNPPWTQQFFFISLFVTPILSRYIILNDKVWIFILYSILMLIISCFSIFSLYTTFVPLAMALCTLTLKFIHIDSSKKNHFWKKNALITLQIFLFLILCELFYYKFTDLLQNARKNPFLGWFVELFIGNKYSLYPSKVLIQSNQLNYFPRVGIFFEQSDECTILIIGYILISAFYKKSNLYYENCFLIIAFLSLLIPSYQDAFSSNTEIHFFVFKIYLFIAFTIQCSRLKSKCFFFSATLILLFSALHDDACADFINNLKYEFRDFCGDLSSNICTFFNK